ncbi:MAG: LPS-assembly protein LptD [Rhodobacteraceae bacterium]|nr:LPS-assembly protein LptD [Paracoccaceae bacterium]
MTRLRRPAQNFFSLSVALLAALMWLSAPVRAHAQDAPAPAPASDITTLAADLVRVEGEDILIATGNVEVMTNGARLRASELRYDRAHDLLQITGPITLQDADGTVLLADQAELERDLQNGMIRGARLILNDQLQITGAEMARRQGRYSDLRQVAASSCEICRPGQSPLWEIRAKRVIHDQQEKQIYFYGARFRIKGVPVFYLPTLRVPDGTEDRVSGFLTPSTRTTTELGNGVKIPYYFVLGEHADLKLTPYLADDYTTTLEARYRQAFVNGLITVNGAVSKDSIMPGETRGYLFLDGRFDIPHDFILTFDVETTSDDPYLRDYDYSQKDRLDSAIGVRRIRPDERIDAELVRFQSLRADVDDDDDPRWVGDVRWNTRFQPGGLGGWFDANLVAHMHKRESSENITGRDMAQIRGTLNWARIWTVPGGLRFSAQTRLNADMKRIDDDDRYPSFQTALIPEGALTLALPLSRAGQNGTFYTLEPVAQLAWSAPGKLDSPNDDSTAVALDTGNLLRLNRFPGLDLYEEGTRANLALRWSRVSASGLSIAFTGGRIFWQEDLDQFAEGSGLDGMQSDWLAQVDIDLGGLLSLRNATLMDDTFAPTLSETRLAMSTGSLGLSSSYIWQRADTSSSFDDDVNEIALFADYQLNDTWSAELDLRRDFTAQRTNYAKLGIAYQNECVRVDLSARRSFRATSDVDPSYAYGISVSLPGFGTQETAQRRRRCSK